jgi:hypothetical protein
MRPLPRGAIGECVDCDGLLWPKSRHQCPGRGPIPSPEAAGGPDPMRTRPDYDLRCERCAAPHNLDTSIPSSIWNQVARPKAYSILCTLCIDDLVASAGLICEAEFYFVGRAVSSKLYGPLELGGGPPLECEHAAPDICGVCVRAWWDAAKPPPEAASASERPAEPAPNDSVAGDETTMREVREWRKSVAVPREELEAVREALLDLRDRLTSRGRFYSGAKDWRCDHCGGLWDAPGHDADRQPHNADYVCDAADALDTIAPVLARLAARLADESS